MCMLNKCLTFVKPGMVLGGQGFDLDAHLKSLPNLFFCVFMGCDGENFGMKLRINQYIAEMHDKMYLF